MQGFVPQQNTSSACVPFTVCPGSLVPQGHTDIVMHARVSNDGSFMASCGMDGTVRLWNWRTGKLIHTLTGHVDAVQCLDVSPCSRYVVSCGGCTDRTVVLWNAAEVMAAALAATTAACPRQHHCLSHWDTCSPLAVHRSGAKGVPVVLVSAAVQLMHRRQAAHAGWMLHVALTSDSSTPSG
jgi:WD40 repeat protein